jgi:hypothetical protein
MGECRKVVSALSKDTNKQKISKLESRNSKQIQMTEKGEILNKV